MKKNEDYTFMLTIVKIILSIIIAGIIWGLLITWGMVFQE